MGTYLSRTPGSAGNRKTWTISFWLKRSQVTSSEQAIFTQRIDSSNRFSFGVSGTGEFNVYNRVGGSTYNATTSGLHRDFSAWYHVVYKMDTTQASSSNRQAIYVNGVEASLSTDTVPSQNDDTAVNSTSECMWGYWANSWGNTQNLDGYLAECYMIDGQSLAPTSFGETDSTTGIWIPKTFSGSYGTNGFRLEFKNSGALGTDTSGNSNTFTVNNAGTGAQVVDTPSNVFANANSNMKSTSDVVLTNGALTVTSNYSSGWQYAGCTMAVNNGKWYWEAKATVVSASDKTFIGVGQFGTADVNFVGVLNLGLSNGLTGHGAGVGGYSYSQGDIIMVAMDITNNKIYYGKNGTWFGTLDPANGTGSTTQTVDNSNSCVPMVGGYGGSKWDLNFGNPTITISSGNADANGYGNFEYAVPSGYYALCTENLNTYG